MYSFIIVLFLVVSTTSGAPNAPVIRPDIYRNLVPSDTRIIGGQYADRHQFPYQASIHWGIFGVTSHICGGTLINEKYVLTAGHCKASSVGTYEVVLGVLHQSEIGSNEDVQTHKVDQFIVHPNFTGGVGPNDIALVKLAAPATLNDAVQLASLPTSECEALKDVVLSGWGLTSWLPMPPDSLRWAQLPRISNDQCANDLTALIGNSGPLDDTMICTSANEGQKQSACSGDSGGPLVQSNKTIVGIVSWGISPCGTKGAPSVYTNVCSHLDWIDENISA